MTEVLMDGNVLSWERMPSMLLHTSICVSIYSIEEGSCPLTHPVLTCVGWKQCAEKWSTQRRLWLDDNNEHLQPPILTTCVSPLQTCRVLT